MRTEPVVLGVCALSAKERCKNIVIFLRTNQKRRQNLLEATPEDTTRICIMHHKMAEITRCLPMLDLEVNI